MSERLLEILSMIIRIFIVTVITLILTLGTGIILYTNGYLIPNEPEAYTVRGVDVSSYQGNIDWERLSANADFAYIKATEGSGSVDPCFQANYTNASNADLRVGFYMFFSFDSPGITQAENFIRSVEGFDNMLPPAIDIEFYANKEHNPPSREDVNLQLDILISQIEKHYGIKPIIYSTSKAYNMYIAGKYEDCDIWIRDVFSEPVLSDGRSWTFWQYSDKGRLDCYDGSEKFIDMNVFCGTAEEFRKYPESKD